MASYNTYIVTKSGERIEFTLDCANRKKLALSVREGRLTVRVPLRYRKEDVVRFIEDNLGWIHSALEKSGEKYGLPMTFEDGEKIRLLGQTLTIRLEISDRYHEPIISEDRLLVAVREDSTREYVAGQINGFIYSLATKEVKESMNRLTAVMGLYPKKVTLKSMTASWGRCSSEGNISMNYKVIAYPKKNIDYVCIHELAHLRHMNHSRDFWALVEKYCPDYRQIRDSMRA